MQEIFCDKSNKPNKHIFKNGKEDQIFDNNTPSPRWKAGDPAARRTESTFLKYSMLLKAERNKGPK